MHLVTDSSLLPATAVPAGATILITLPFTRALAPDEARGIEAEIRALALHRLYRLVACATLPDQVLVLVQSGPTPFQALLNLLRARLAQKIQHLLTPHAGSHVPTFTATVIPDALALRLSESVLLAARTGNTAALRADLPPDLHRLAPTPASVALAA